MTAKCAVVSPPTLSFYDPSCPTSFQTYASHLHGLGFILMQKQDDDSWDIVQCGSRFLTETKSRYAAIEPELLGIVWAIQKCRLFLSGLSLFSIFTDHKPLIPILNSSFLADHCTVFSLDVVWISGSNTHVRLTRVRICCVTAREIIHKATIKKKLFSPSFLSRHLRCSWCVEKFRRRRGLWAAPRPAGTSQNDYWHPPNCWGVLLFSLVHQGCMRTACNLSFHFMAQEEEGNTDKSSRKIKSRQKNVPVAKSNKPGLKRISRSWHFSLQFPAVAQITKTTRKNRWNFSQCDRGLMTAVGWRMTSSKYSLLWKLIV